MDLDEYEPRAVPKPVSFCQDPLLNPSVPEVSLIFQDNSTKTSPLKNDSFSGTEFQTYNAWRWKNMNSNDKPLKEKPSYLDCSSSLDCCIIKDKYFTSDVERRKNEILYGKHEEPRDPVLPRPCPVIPNSFSESFPELSFISPRSSQWNIEEERNAITFNAIGQRGNFFSKSTVRERENSDNIKTQGLEDMFQVMTEQNKQLNLLQKQIDNLVRSQDVKEKQVEQLLKTQDMKEKQIEQLLKSQEMKDLKIEQLLESIEVKEKRIEQLLTAQDKKDRQVEQLMKSLEVKEVQRLELLKKIESKQMVTVAVMASQEVADKSTNINSECCLRKCCNTGRPQKDQKESQDKSLTLNSIDLPVLQEHTPSPRSSIRLDLQDYADSSQQGSDDVCDSFSEKSAPAVPHSSEVNPWGHTFYNKLMTQVKDIIENTNDKEEKNEDVIREQTVEREPLLEFNRSEKDFNEEKGESLERMQNWGMNLYGRENTRHLDDMKNKNGHIDSLNYELNSHRRHEFTNEAISPTDVSLKMNALAMKYLKQEQLKQYDLTSPPHSVGRQPDVTIYNVTNLSFGTMRYLERYRILPNNRSEKVSELDVHSPSKLLMRKKKFLARDEISPVDPFWK